MVEVFSWRTGCWKVIDGRAIGACVIHEGQNGVVINGGLHWLGNSAGKSGGIQKFILSFDLNTEEFRRIPTPEFSTGVCVKIMGFKGLLALAFYPSKSLVGRPAATDRVEICVWDDYGGADGKYWTKLNSLQLNTLGYPVGVTNETGLIMRKLDGQFTQFFLCDPSNQNYRRLHICEATYSCDIHSYVESLVPVSAGHDHRVIEEEVLSEV
ncbi:F-box/kelch-repeat protein [Populus alba x Populus x berolinensis]|nr:F-box/kelch-repeat protein [Populus alba x Populus x berolinensis]